MKTMRRRTSGLALGVAVLCMGLATTAAAQLTKDELKCESGTGKALPKLTGAWNKCTQKCVATGRKTSGPYTDCFSPYGGATLACVEDSTKGAEAKAAGAIVKACTKDCPECYEPSVCTSGQPLVSDTGDLLGQAGPVIYCTEYGGGTPSKAQAKCEDAVGKTLAKFIASKAKCYDKCTVNEFNGKVPAGSCVPPTPADADTVECIDKAETKSVASIDKACSDVSANPPCYDGSTYPNSGTGWTGYAEAIVDFQVPIVACGSPSGAFLE
jgi:hypothetical protein